MAKRTSTAKASAKPANCCKRPKLDRWAELLEKLGEFQRLLDTAADDNVLDEMSVQNIADTLRNLKGDLFSAIPDVMT